MTKQIPVYAKGGFKVREQTPLGYAANRREANQIVRAQIATTYHGANGHHLENAVMGVEELQDEHGEYYVAIRQIRENV